MRRGRHGSLAQLVLILLGVAKLLFLRVGYEHEHNHNGLLARALGNADFSSDRIADPGADVKSFGNADFSPDRVADPGANAESFRSGSVWMRD